MVRQHHLFPDLPSNRYSEIAPEVRALCEKYGLSYNTGPLSRQIGTVWLKILRLALPTVRYNKHIGDISHDPHLEAAASSDSKK